MREFDLEFWALVDRLVGEGEIVIDRPRGSAHPKYPSLVYPTDYGYIKNTASMDGGGIDVYVGTASVKRADAVICTVDIIKRDSEIKILIGCTADEKDAVYKIHNSTEYMKGVMVLR